MSGPIYSKISSGTWRDELVVKTNKIIDETYAKYKPYYEFIIDFIKSNKYLISSLELLLGQDIPYDKHLHIYVLNPNAVASELFKKLCQKFNKEFVLRAEVIDQHYSLDRITKTYIRISHIDQYKNVSLIDFVAPIQIKGLMSLPSILELIDLYKKIYNPEFAEDWADLIEQAKKIKQITDKNIRESIAKFQGGKDCVDCKDKRKLAVDSIKQDTIQFLHEYPDYVMVHMPNSDSTESLAVISKNTIQTDFERLNNYLAKRGDFTIIFKKKNLFIGKDQRISKYTMYVSIGHGNDFANIQKPFLDIYNNMEYELIPYAKHAGVAIAHPWVEIRFYYIEIWNILAAFQLKMLDYKKFAAHTHGILDTIDKLKVDWTVAPEQFMGIYINEYYAFKKTMLLEGSSTRLYC